MSNATQPIHTGREGRQQPRTHLFVSATLYADVGSSPVNIRNMSPSGALIEAAVLPDVGERIALKRGQLQASGWIAWRIERRAGVKLEASIHVPDWMSRQVSAGQERVDAMLSLVRNQPLGGAAAPAQSAPASIESELDQLRKELAELEKTLIEDVIVVATHPEIQTFDISLQRIDRILRRLRTGG